MTVKQVCHICGRFITRTRRGNGTFRRHVAEKGILCSGSWLYPDDTKKIAEAMKITSMQKDE